MPLEHGAGRDVEVSHLQPMERLSRPVVAKRLKIPAVPKVETPQVWRVVDCKDSHGKSPHHHSGKVHPSRKSRLETDRKPFSNKGLGRSKEEPLKSKSS
jgi:hypothetical protein